MEESNNNNDFNVVNVKDFPFGNSTREKKSKMHGLPHAFLGYSTRRLTFLPFCFLLISSILFFVGYVFMCFRFRKIISKLNLETIFALCILLCIVDTIAAILGIRFLSKTILSACKLFLLHGVMFMAILIHIFIPSYQFIPNHKVLNSIDNKTQVNTYFPDAYWKCRDNKEIKKLIYYDHEKSNSNNCPEILWIGYIFWSTLVLFLVLLIAWKMSLCRSPTPIHPDVKSSSQFLAFQAGSRRAELEQMYRKWQIDNKMNKPYLAHYPRSMYLGDQNLNLLYQPLQSQVINTVVPDLIPSLKISQVLNKGVKNEVIVFSKQMKKKTGDSNSESD